MCSLTFASLNLVVMQLVVVRDLWSDEITKHLLLSTVSCPIKKFCINTTSPLRKLWPASDITEKILTYLSLSNKVWFSFIQICIVILHVFKMILMFLILNTDCMSCHIQLVPSFCWFVHMYVIRNTCIYIMGTGLMIAHSVYQTM